MRQVVSLCLMRWYQRFPWSRCEWTIMWFCSRQRWGEDHVAANAGHGAEAGAALFRTYLYTWPFLAGTVTIIVLRLFYFASQYSLDVLVATLGIVFESYYLWCLPKEPNPTYIFSAFGVTVKCWNLFQLLILSTIILMLVLFLSLDFTIYFP